MDSVCGCWSRGCVCIVCVTLGREIQLEGENMIMRWSLNNLYNYMCDFKILTMSSMFLGKLINFINVRNVFEKIERCGRLLRVMPTILERKS